MDCDERWKVDQHGTHVEITNGRRGSKYRHITNALPVYEDGPKDKHGVSLSMLERAHVMAAAPLMLYQLQNIVANLSGTDCQPDRIADSIHRASAAIAAATPLTTIATKGKQ